jgi:hypothetical protein
MLGSGLPIFAGCIVGCAFLVFGQTGVLTPPADADPSVRHEIVVSVPARLSVERTLDRISVGFDPASPRNVKIAAGRNMTVGVKYEMRVYAAGERRPLNAGAVGYAGISESVSASLRGLVNGRDFLNTAQGGIPSPGKRYNIEEEVFIFETDVPARHMWMPESKKYRVLWEKRLKTVA